MADVPSNQGGIARLLINDYENWGKLVKTWATGRNYLEDGQSYPRPADIAHLHDQMVRAGAGTAPLSDADVTLEIIDMDDDTVYVMLPPKDVIAKVEQDLQNGVLYPLPAFYLKTVIPSLDAGWPAAAALNFHHARVGEYCVQFCA
jgi:hypothetical protein